MAIVMIKIGENETNLYAKFNKLSKNMDIIDVVPRGRPNSMGAKGDKEFFGLNVDMDDLTDAEFSQVRYYLREPEYDETAPMIPDGTADGMMRDPQIKTRRIRYIDLSLISEIGISAKTVTSLNTMASLKRSKSEYDMTTINKLDIKVPFNNFAKCVKNKLTGKTLYQELELDKQSVKTGVSKIG